MGFSGVTMDTFLLIENLNLAGRLDGTNIRFKIRKKSDGSLLAEGDVPREFSLSGGQKTTISFPVTYGYGGMSAVGGSLIRRGETDLLVEGDITFAAPMVEKGTVDTPYKGEVVIVLSDDPPVE
jgi:hypothetical protein